MSFVIKTRGARGLMLADYECPDHGYFEATVRRDDAGDPPVSEPCLVHECQRPSSHRISAVFGRVNPFEAVKGKWEKPERKTWTDTRNVGEGQPVYEWKEDRAKVWEEKRKQDTYNFAREHNERVIGGD